ncbi:DUF1501 domain-containing protein [Marinicella sp. S1101]|uniref:DUF1501 domain-containing protein n=1 Tax=Marinicella marina TaxID=2996016 RepID=UPI002260DE39|nr:DUF1501 domain-containing protein [Marinicella marina]MCX7552481.1 DUF1501 domain-containing protein [Marinicella marina]MDJ1139357.1 DUF1501 domain-containing protein [Marinicella marina]
MKKINRRNFLKGSGLVSVAGLGGMQLGFANQLLKGGSGNGRDLLVYVFLNGGMDGLNMVPPRSGNDYNQYSNVLRPSLHIPNNVSLPLNGQNAFGMHPSATGLANLFNSNKMAIVHATGLVEANRSHFEATRFLELGFQGSNSLGTGWLTRYFNSSLHTPNDAVMPSIVPSYDNTDAVLGDPTALVLSNPGDFALTDGHWTWGDTMQDILQEITENPVSLEQLVNHQILKASDIIQAIDWANYVPGNSASYPEGFLGEQLRMVAQLYKSDVDLEVAYVPTGGWDTHVGQGTGTEGQFADLTSELSAGLYALYQDLTASHNGRFTIMVQSEFGRRAYENSASSTDHGYANPMFIIGDNVNGGFHGQFPGLAPEQLFEGDDVNATVDYRDVVSEVLIKRQRNRFLGYIFPGYDDYSPLGVVNGADLSPVYEENYDPLFASGFD